MQICIAGSENGTRNNMHLLLLFTLFLIVKRDIWKYVIKPSIEDFEVRSYGLDISSENNHEVQRHRNHLLLIQFTRLFSDS